MILTLVAPSDLRRHWPRILGSLCAVRTKAPCDWIAEDVYHAIKSGAAACHVGEDNGYAGVLITTLTHAEFSGERALHVWIVHNAGEADALEAGLPLLRQMAQAAGAKRITFGSPRPGWAKRFAMTEATYTIPMETP